MTSPFKKLISLFLLFTLLFNSGGELVLRQILVYKADRYFNKQTGRGLYNLGDVTEVRLPVNMKGIFGDTEYISTFGEVRFADAAYNYVAMKITKTAIYLKCIPNYETTRLCADNIIHAEGIKHIPLPRKEHVPYGKSCAAAGIKYKFQSFEFTVPVKNILSELCESTGEQSDRPLDIPQPPPKFVA